ncbi:MAG: hypothetical protein ABI120_23760 [Gemmatimonadaceae bacterium]
MSNFPIRFRAGAAVRAFVVAAMMIACGSPKLQAQRVVRDTASQWHSARLLTLTPQNQWCVSGDDAGCDFKSIDDAFVLSDGGLIASGAMGPIHHCASGGAFINAPGAKGQGPGEYTVMVHPQRIKNHVVWFDNGQMRSTSVPLSGAAGSITLIMLPQSTQNRYSVNGTLTVFDGPVAATPGDTVDGVYRTVPASGAPHIFAKIRTPDLFAPGTNFRAAAGPFAPRNVAGVSVNGDVAHTNGRVYVVHAFLRKEAPRRQRLTLHLARLRRRIATVSKRWPSNNSVCRTLLRCHR